MSEQLSLFTIHPVEISKPKHDPYWDEITSDFTNQSQNDTVDADSCCGGIAGSAGSTEHPSLRLGVVSPNLLPKSAPEQVAVGDWVKVSLEWLNKCRNAVDKRFHKYYQHKSNHDLVCKVIGLSDEGGVYIPRGPQRRFFVPSRYFEIAPEHPYTNVRAQVANITTQLAPEHTHYTEEYWVKRGSKKHYYYRYCWMIGRKKDRIHIGSVNSPLARARREEIEIAIADGETPASIQNLIRSWKA